MKPGGEQLGGRAPLGEGVGKHHAPAPRVASTGRLRLHHPGLPPPEREPVASIAVPGVDLRVGEAELGPWTSRRNSERRSSRGNGRCRRQTCHQNKTPASVHVHDSLPVGPAARVPSCQDTRWRAEPMVSRRGRTIDESLALRRRTSQCPAWLPPNASQTHADSLQRCFQFRWRRFGRPGRGGGHGVTGAVAGGYSCGSIPPSFARL
jgi:hypothetical protein